MDSTQVEMPRELYTDRLILRAPIGAEDGAIVNRAVKESINELKRWLPFAQDMPTVEQTEANLQDAHVKFLANENFRFLIFHQESLEFIGTASLQSIDWEVGKCEIGYWVNTKFGGNGYMTEAVKALMELGLDRIGFTRIEIRCESTNIASRAIPEKIGCRLEGILVNDDLSADGKTLTDTCVYAITQ